MNAIAQDITKAIDKELEAAINAHGLHHSLHEKIAIIAEEVEEASEEMNNVKNTLHMAWIATRHDDEVEADEWLRDLIIAARNLAIEACQTAAMAMKALEDDAAKDHTQGTWTMERRSDEDITDWKCSNCKTYVDLPSNRAPFRFCPNCGKEMKVKK